MAEHDNFKLFCLQILLKNLVESEWKIIYIMLYIMQRNLKKKTKIFDSNLIIKHYYRQGIIRSGEETI